MDDHGSAGRLVIPVPELARQIPGAAVVLIGWHDPDHDSWDDLATFFSDVVAFDYRFTEPTRFPDGTAYLAPEPSAPFRNLAHALHHEFPDETPRPTLGTQGVPHLLLPGETAASSLTSLLPLQSRASEALLRQDATTLARFPFGTTAA